jgi:GT2 family glycosyltransferase
VKFGAFIVTYNRPMILKESLKLLLAQTHPPEVILVVDNGDPEENKLVVKAFPAEKVIHEIVGSNLGSAGGFAFGVKWFYERGYDWIYCGDDDNPPVTADTFERLLKLGCISDDIGAVGSVGAQWDWKKGETQRLPDERLDGIVAVDFIGQNNSFTLRKEAVASVGLPNADLFFGYPDLEYCLRIRRAGYRLLVDGKLMYEHRARDGRLNLVKKQTLLPSRSYNSIWRNYYTTRSYIFMMTQIFKRSDLARREALKAAGRILMSWTRGLKYGAAFTGYELRGVVDGYLGRLGQTVTPKPKTVR